MTLTREAIEAMQPGPDMDAAVAEFVMGWDRDGMRTSSPPPPHFTVDTAVMQWGDKAPVPRVIVFDHPDHDGPAVFAPSTDADAAQAVINMLMQKFGAIDTITLFEDGNHRVTIKNCTANGKPFCVAICRAALLTTL